MEEKQGREEKGRKGGKGETCHTNPSLRPAPLSTGTQMCGLNCSS